MLVTNPLDDPLFWPTALILGSILGARLLPRLKTNVLRLVFGVVILALGIEMIFHGLTGRV